MPKKATPTNAVDATEAAPVDVVDEALEPVAPAAPPMLDRDALAAKYGQHKSRRAYMRARLDDVKNEATAGAFCDEFASGAYPRDVMMAELFDLLT